MKKIESWIQFIASSYIRCCFVIAFIVLQWLIIKSFYNTSTIFVFTMSLVGILATKIIFDKETEIKKLKDRLDENNINHTDITSNDHKEAH
ncbi:MAG: hypothetical protein ACRBBR_08805 [Cellvibrionaceae bacterium]